MQLLVALLAALSAVGLLPTTAEGNATLITLIAAMSGLYRLNSGNSAENGKTPEDP